VHRIVRRPKYGRKLDDFLVGDVYDHPWEVTIDDGMLALWQSSFLDANPLYSSNVYARSIGFSSRVIPASLVLNLGLSFSVHDVSQQAIAHLAYIDVRFPRPLYPGDTFKAFSEVLGVKPSKKPDRGTVHVRTTGVNQHGEAVLSFERKALIRAGKVEGRPDTPVRTLTDLERQRFAGLPFAPPNAMAQADGAGSVGQPFFFEDFAEGDIIVHDSGRTIGKSEHMMLTTLVRNSHPLHWDHGYCQENSFKKDMIVYGGLVLSWTLGMASWDIGGNVLWECGLDAGAHPAPVLGNDTIYAASKIIGTNQTSRYTGELKVRTVGVKNVHPEQLLEAGRDLFTAERAKTDKADRVPEKVVEITRDVMIRRRAS
jgi:2-methylfumaryl-CoA hydratase